jgi:hypothetical protein
MGALGFRHLTDPAERGLTAHLRRAVETTFGSDELTRVARVWLYELGYVLPAERRVTLLVRAVLRHAEHALSKRMAAQFAPKTVASLLNDLMTSKEGEGGTVLEWLRDPPHRAGRREIADYVQPTPDVRSDHLLACGFSPLPDTARVLA